MEFDIYAPVPMFELQNRLKRLRTELTNADKNWSMVIINNPINLYYLTGTMPEGILTITKTDAVLWVRKGYERAKKESLFEDIRQMKSFRTVCDYFGQAPDTIYIEHGYATIKWISMVQKYFRFYKYKDIAPLLQKLRLNKSEYELECIKKSGQIQSHVTEKILPTLLKEGISEAEVCMTASLEMVKLGSMGVNRFENPLGESSSGICSFSENALYGLSFDSPDGCKGTYIAVQSIGSNNRKLKKGDIVFADIPCGVAGYHTDKTVVYFYGKLSENPNGDIIKRAYNVCIEIEKKTAQMLKPNVVLSELYEYATSLVPEEFKQGFMFGKKFIGHSIGLCMDESPAIAKSFEEKLSCNQVFALEPKIALDGLGIVGSENTYLVTENGGICLTGSILPIIEV